MLPATARYHSRPPRYVPSASDVRVTSGHIGGALQNISESGLLFQTSAELPTKGDVLSGLHVEAQRLFVPLPEATVVRTINGTANLVACRFEGSGSSALDSLQAVISPPAYITGALRRGSLRAAG